MEHNPQDRRYRGIGLCYSTLSTHRNVNGVESKSVKSMGEEREQEFGDFVDSFSLL
jgi:hypothetical protein